MLRLVRWVLVQREKGDRRKGNSYSECLSIGNPVRGLSISFGYSLFPSPPPTVLTGPESVGETRLPEYRPVETIILRGLVSLDSVGRLQTTRLSYQLIPQLSKMSKLKNLAIMVIFLCWLFALKPLSTVLGGDFPKLFIANVEVW